MARARTAFAMRSCWARAITGINQINHRCPRRAGNAETRGSPLAAVNATITRFEGVFRTRPRRDLQRSSRPSGAADRYHGKRPSHRNEGETEARISARKYLALLS